MIPTRDTEATIKCYGTPAELIALMRDFRAHTLDLIGDLDDDQMIGPRLAIVNPPLWEIGHIAWFQEFWVLRHLRRQKPLIENGDQLYNSTDVAHDTRWELLLPPREATVRYMDNVLDRITHELNQSTALSANDLYFHMLATFHEGMHAEALAYTRQTLGYPAPRFTPSLLPSPLLLRQAQDRLSPETGEGIGNNMTGERIGGGACPGDVEVPGGTFTIGATPDFSFVFDNEKWAHPVVIKPFRIARAPVTNAEFLAFVEDGGYRKQQFWSADGWKWLHGAGASPLTLSFAKFFNRDMSESKMATTTQHREHPVYWHKQDNGRWQQRIFDRYESLNEHLPVIHVSWYEAEAFCNWAGRRLPSEAEWEIAASAEPDRSGVGIGKSRRRFPWGDDPPASEQANLDWQNSGPVEVGAFAQGDSAFGCRQMIGNIWEWTADTFQPYPGFIVDPYKEYSQPWFGTHKVLRGGCWATRAQLIRNTWRNFYTPDRNDVWAGFRTCAR